MPSKDGRTPETHEPGEYHYHYNREEREAMLSEETRRLMKKTKFFTMNRRNMIILADIAIILLFTMIFAPFALGGKTKATVSGFRINLKSYEYDGSLLVSLKIEATEDNNLEDGLVRAVFSVDGKDEKVEVLDLLPAKIDDPRVLRAELESSDKKKHKIFAVVEIEGKIRKLSVTAKSE